MTDPLSGFGKDDGIKCDCGRETWRTYDQGYGLVSYECSVGHAFQVQYEWPDEYEYEDEYYYSEDLP